MLHLGQSPRVATRNPPLGLGVGIGALERHRESVCRDNMYMEQPAPMHPRWWLHANVAIRHDLVEVMAHASVAILLDIVEVMASPPAWPVGYGPS
jgi:hypothetical protein